MKHFARRCSVLSFFFTLCVHLCRGIDTLIGIQGRDFVMLASDPLLHRSLVVMQQDRDKMPVVSRRRMLAIGGPPYFVDALGEIMRADVGILEKRLRHPLSTKTVAHLCRRLFLEFRGLPSTMLVAGYDEGTSTAWPEAEGPCLYWLDSLGAMQKLRYAVHGEASSFLLSMLDQMCTSAASASSEEREGGLTEEQALDIMKRCHEELQRRFLVNPGSMLQVKVVDRDGCRRVELAAGSKGQRPPPISPRSGSGSGDGGGKDGGSVRPRLGPTRGEAGVRPRSPGSVHR